MAGTIAALAWLGATVPLAAYALPQSVSAERLFAVDGSRLYEIDTTTGTPLWSKYVSYGGAAGFWCATWDGDRLVSLRRGAPNTSDELLTIHPADAVAAFVGLTGDHWTYAGMSLEVDPASGALYGVHGTDLYVVHRNTGSIVATIPVQPPGTYVQGLAIDGQGNAYTTSYSYPATRLYSLDLNTGDTSLIGSVSIGPGAFEDLAVSATGEVWGYFYDVQAPYTEDGVYRVDPTTAFATLVWRNPNHFYPYTGLAFAPAPSIATYCTAKINSAFCPVLIAGTGWPSQTATSGFTVTAWHVRNNSFGVLLYGASGRAALPFGGGYLCVAGNPRRTPIQWSGGSVPPVANCTGQWSIDFNEWLNSLAPLPAGLTLDVQWYGRDPGFAAPNNVQLSNGLEFVLQP